MSAGGAAARYVSVSELYCADEVELLLDEIRELEPTSCRGEEPQDCEIAGSGAARSPAPTERSWDSHAGYQRAPPLAPRRAVPLYCRARDLRAPYAIVTLLIVVCGASSVSCVWAVTGLRGRLPLDSRSRLLALAGLSSALLHTALLYAHVTRLIAVLPLRWDLLVMFTSVWSGLSLLTGGSLLLHAVLLAPEYSGAPERPFALLTAAAVLGMTGALVSLGVVSRAAWACLRAVPAAAAAPGADGEAGGAGAGAARGAYRAVPCAPPAPAAGPSTSRDL